MKVGLCVFELSKSTEENMSQVIDALYEMKAKGAELAVFSETCLTGLANSGDCDSDIELAITSKDSFLKELARLSYKLKVSVSIGFLEKFEGLLFDTLLFLDSTEKKHYLYRRMSKGWKTASCDP